ncbi:hypothetical protein [Lentzea sp. NPDC003310]|uniref:hypothetical protein n=1 Tax=Lentzea sp. NPDC003310 TaxID=3154447 RepID=UPI0033AEE773
MSEIGCPEADKLLRNALYNPEREARQDKSALRHVEDVNLDSNSKQRGAGRGTRGTGAMR